MVEELISNLSPTGCPYPNRRRVTNDLHRERIHLARGVCAVHRWYSGCGNYEMEDEMSEIYTYGQWIDIVDRGTSGDQVMDILASWKVDAYKLLEDNHKLEAELARRDEELALTEKKLCNIDRSARAEVARRDEIITRLKEDAERLASTYVVEVFPHEWVCRGGCHHWARFGEQIDHAPDCPITLHRALMKELE